MTPGKRTVIAHGTVAADYGSVRAHVVIEDERIVALSDDDAVLHGADELIDARGRFVLPGAIDLHSHFEDPGHTEREDFTTGTMAAAAGGFTTVVEHPLTYPPTTTVELYTQKRAMAERKAVVDFGLWGALTSTALGQMEGQWAEGALGFKAFMPVSDPSYPHVDDDELLQGMRTVAALGGIVLIHAENDALLRGNISRLRAAGRTDTLAHYESRPPFVEEEAVHRALFLAAHAGARVQIVHTSSPVSVDLIAAARRGGLAATAEVCPHHLLLDLDDGLALGPYGACAPALRERALVEGMWERVLDGTIDCLVSDHAAYPIAEKELGREDIFEVPLGCQVIQETVPLVLSEAVHERGMALDAFVRFSSTNAARIAGLYPRKGTLLPGSDADVAIWDLDARWSVDAVAQQFSKNPWSPFAGRAVRGRVLRTLVRGETVFADGEIHVAPGHGGFVSGVPGALERGASDSGAPRG
ncbi:allantoinase AllB [Conexibacter sp. CPCC 206217]|uniref:allantoinase AllB n=1 Tax=Conexibacter sp. CPCC 206217 TaxID=3064574 RepID=UPI002728E0B4|nr:allantoinase AllB [Conexibacter sp. CPCC 206217]MDO8212627.1 allantoinase AllB [Conexibacter sp. CPCC 206217]